MTRRTTAIRPTRRRGCSPSAQEVARWYATRYGVKLDPATEVLGLIGSKEGCHHFVLACVNPGDVVLMTDPGYPAYRASILMGEGIPYNVPILPGERLPPGIREDPGGDRQEGDGDLPELPEQPDRRLRDAGILRQARRLRQGQRQSPSATTTPTARSSSTARSG